MWAFLGSDCMFFGTLIATYLVYKNRSVSGPFPIDVFDIPTTSVSTFVLLMSSMSMVLAYSSLTRGRMKAFRIWLASTAILGMTFLAFQVFEFPRVRQPRSAYRLRPCRDGGVDRPGKRRSRPSAAPALRRSRR